MKKCRLRISDWISILLAIGALCISAHANYIVSKNNEAALVDSQLRAEMEHKRWWVTEFSRALAEYRSAWDDLNSKYIGMAGQGDYKDRHEYYVLVFTEMEKKELALVKNQYIISCLLDQNKKAHQVLYNKLIELAEKRTETFLFAISEDNPDRISDKKITELAMWRIKERKKLSELVISALEKSAYSSNLDTNP
ncbi:MAG: hypothetical protein ACERJ1_16820 [Halodesulfovibrio sp.]|uniref:hypothetical protein n=1 Tax=Halodesulfovibrio sp. TaxID=1912772 RepID=UPI00359EA086